MSESKEKMKQMSGHCRMSTYITKHSHTHTITVSTTKYTAGERQFLLKYPQLAHHYAINVQAAKWLA